MAKMEQFRIYEEVSNSDWHERVVVWWKDTRLVMVILVKE